MKFVSGNTYPLGIIPVGSLVFDGDSDRTFEVMNNCFLLHKGCYFAGQRMALFRYAAGGRGLYRDRHQDKHGVDSSAVYPSASLVRTFFQRLKFWKK